MRINVNLRELLNKRGIDYNELEVMSGLSRKTIERIKRGQTPSLGTASRIAAVLDVSIDELMYGNKSDETIDHAATRAIWEEYKKYDESYAINLAVASKLYSYVYRPATMRKNFRSDDELIEFLRYQMYIHQYFVFMEPDIAVINSVPDDVVLELYHKVDDIISGRQKNSIDK